MIAACAAPTVPMCRTCGAAPGEIRLRRETFFADGNARRGLRRSYGCCAQERREPRRGLRLHRDFVEVARAWSLLAPLLRPPRVGAVPSRARDYGYVENSSWMRVRDRDLHRSFGRRVQERREPRPGLRLRREFVADAREVATRAAPTAVPTRNYACINSSS